MGLYALIVPMLLFAGPHLVQGDYFLHHPQAQFCSAGFVLGAEVLKFDAKSNSYGIKVLYIFKDEVDISKAEGTLLGAGITLKLYNSRYNFPLRVRKVYILAGQLQNGKLELNKADWIFPLRPSDNEWKNLSPTQKEGLYFRYKRGCKCQIGLCYPNCSQKVPGCGYSALEKRPPMDMCRMKHQFCEMKADKGTTLCHWRTRATNEFKDCEGN